MIVITSAEWELPTGSFVEIRQLREPGDVCGTAQVSCYVDHQLLSVQRSSGQDHGINPFSFQVWDAIEGTLRSSNDEGQSGITALVFLNNR